MALRFKKNMFWCWKIDEITRGMVGFRSNDEKYIFDFRDRLSVNISHNKGLIIHKIETGHPTPLDSVSRLFDKKVEEKIQPFFKKKVPDFSFFAVIFRTKNYIRWQKEWDSVKKLAKVEIETTHDFPGLIIDSTIHSSEELSLEIKEVSKESGLELYENKKLENINIYKNWTLE